MSTVDFRGARWRKSSRSSGEGDVECVELADVDSLTGVRDSKNPAGPVLTFPRAGWFSFLAVTRSGNS